MRKTILAVVLFAGLASSAMAANPQPAPFTLKLDTAHAQAPGAGTVSTDIDASSGTAASLPNASSPVAGGPVQPAPVSPQVAAGVPMIPGSLAAAQPAPTTAAAPTPASVIAPVAAEPVASAPATAAPDAASRGAFAAATASGLTPGVPVKVYATLGEAAKAGIDPLGERKAEPAPAPQPVAQAGFNWKSPDAYLAFARQHKSETIQGGLGLLVAALILLLLRRRRG